MNSNKLEIIREEVELDNIRTTHLGKTCRINNSIIASIENAKPKVDSIMFLCPECAAKINVKQENPEIRYPPYCGCGRRHGFQILSKSFIDEGLIKITNPFIFNNPILIVKLHESFAEPSSMNQLRIGKKINIVGIFKIDMTNLELSDANYFFEPEKIELLEELSNKEKELIVWTTLIHSKTNKREKINQVLIEKSLNIAEINEQLEILAKDYRINFKRNGDIVVLTDTEREELKKYYEPLIEPQDKESRSKNYILEIISNLEASFDKNVPEEEIIVEAESRGIERDRVLSILEKLKHDGKIFSPKDGFIRRV